MRDPIEIEWRRLLARVRRKGSLESAEYVSDLVRKRRCPMWYPYKLSYHLMKRGEFFAAGKLLKNARRFGQADPLIDSRYGIWLWCTGKRAAAIQFVARQAKIWSASFLFSDLSAMYKLSGEKQKAEEYLRVAGGLAEKELMGEAVNVKTRKNVKR